MKEDDYRGDLEEKVMGLGQKLSLVSGKPRQATVPR